MAAEVSVPIPVIIKPNQNNANSQHRLVLKKCFLFLLISSVKPVTLRREEQVCEGPSQEQWRGEKPKYQQESTTARVTALSVYLKDIHTLYSSTTYTSTTNASESTKKTQKASCTLETWRYGVPAMVAHPNCAAGEESLRHQPYSYQT